jgi:hypothetical protein
MMLYKYYAVFDIQKLGLKGGARLQRKVYMYYECDQLYWQCFEKQDPESLLSDSILWWDSTTQHEGYCMGHWYHVLRRYARCNLTGSEDRLSAISGLANCLADTFGLQYATSL